MALSHAVENQFAVFLGRDIVTAAELGSGLTAVLKRIVERPLLLFDLRGIRLLDLRPEDLDDLCGIVQRAGPAAKGARLAFVADADAVAGVARSFEAVAAGLPIEVNVFREIEAARGWLAYAELGSS